MSLGQITDLVIVVLSVVVTIIFYFYSKHKIEIDKKALQGDALAKAEQMIARSAGAIVFQTDKEGGSGQEKLVSAFNYLTAILDMAHLPHPSTAYIKGEIEKSVTTMKQTKNAVESMQTVTGQYKPVEKTETKKEEKKNA
ncbi:MULTISPECIES: phage holin [Lactobacillus]|jgi:LL-H family phage holin|uniref:phage holin n=1 Tax=Lactobacillus TaxID=1578 RepID=UPI000B98117A|nr:MULTISPECIES: phage holin [Lactobacillus]MBO3729606.1 phage holin [Lactobacillus paragasseri]MED7632387.1 phage holin [Lactobacillus paragasseri]OYS00259.1 phage holin [Lactobacillus taiwanensis]OYS03700.1 phage holin [Lactobacillus taiwanensis]